MSHCDHRRLRIHEPGEDTKRPDDCRACWKKLAKAKK
jgi:hypothetical protein